jgi:putative two-component system response regulator
MSPLRVLVVEDSEHDTELLMRELRRGGFDPVHQRVQTAADMRSALDRESWDLVISDHSVPQFNSTAALALLRGTGRDIPFIIVSGTIGEEAAVEAMRAGANDYIVKGRLARLDPAIRREITEAHHRRARREAEQALQERDRRAALELAEAYDATLEGWARALELRDRETEGHSRRVTELTLRLARFIGASEEDCAHIRRGSLLHDIGKMVIPDAILLKASPLTPDEAALMRKHPTFAYQLLAPIAYLQPALDIPYCHHEKWDGSGYPRGLKGEAIPLAARIFAPADIWDALRSERRYRPAWPLARVRDHIGSVAGTHLDPEIARRFLVMMDEAEDMRPDR